MESPLSPARSKPMRSEKASTCAVSTRGKARHGQAGFTSQGALLHAPSRVYREAALKGWQSHKKLSGPPRRPWLARSARSNFESGGLAEEARHL